MPQPASVLDGGRSGSETVEFQDVLQTVSCLCVAGRSDSDRDAGIQRRQFQILYLAETLSRAIPNTNDCINANPRFLLSKRPAIEQSISAAWFPTGFQCVF